MSPIPGLSAAKAGMRSGDEIIRIDGQKVRTWGEMSELISKSQGEIEVEFFARRSREKPRASSHLRESKNFLEIHPPPHDWSERSWRGENRLLLTF
jgi:regulator of sigma E protease